MAKRILIVDDDPDFQLIVGDSLRRSGYSVSTASTGPECLQLISHQKPDLVILDIMLPGMDGSELGQILSDRSDTKNIPVIFMTALETKEEEQTRGPYAARQTVFAKPPDLKKLLGTIQSLIG